MKELVNLFLQIALLRRGPQDLPASALLLVLTVLACVGVNLLVSFALPPARDPQPGLKDTFIGPLLVSTLYTLAWYVVLLRVVRRPERTLQTTTAVFGLQTLLALPWLACEWLLRRYGEDDTWQIPITCVALMLAAWLIAANSNIVKAALEWSAMASVALVILQMVVGELVVLALFAPVST
jgi:hypothetical protein